MLKVKYSGVNDGKPYPVDMVAFKDGDSVSNLNVENGELKLNGHPVGGGSGGSTITPVEIKSNVGPEGKSYYIDGLTFEEAYNMSNEELTSCLFKGSVPCIQAMKFKTMALDEHIIMIFYVYSVNSDFTYVKEERVYVWKTNVDNPYGTIEKCTPEETA